MQERRLHIQDECGGHGSGKDHRESDRASGSEGDNSKSGRDRECAVGDYGVAGNGRSVGIPRREIGAGRGVGSAV